MVSLFPRFSRKLFAHIETWRPYTVIWCGLLSLTGASLMTDGLPDLLHMTLVLIIPILGWVAGLYLSDYLDVHLDMIQKSHRPIPSGRMHPTEAKVIGSLFASIGLVLTAVFLGIENILLALCAVILVFFYAKMTKSRGILGNVNRGLLATVSFLFGVFSVSTTSFMEIPFLIWLLSVVFLLHDMNTNLVGTFRDKDSDKLGGYQTIPVKYGITLASSLSIGLSLTWVSLTLIILIFFFYPFPDFIYFILILEMFILLAICLSLIRLIQKYSRQKALTIHKWFVLERITLASLFLFLVLPLIIAVSIYLVSLGFTALFQYILRNQYEFSKWEL